MANQLTAQSAITLATETLFGKPLVTNVYRGILVEAMIAEALSGSWQWVSHDWAPHDFENANGARLEVKQSAALQSWLAKSGTTPKPSFDIALRKKVWCEDTMVWTDGATRPEIYVFAYQPVTDKTFADHRDPMQWEFYPVRETDLPMTRRISLRQVQALSASVCITALEDAVAKLP